MQYYSAADILLYPTSDKYVSNFAGISNSVIESLACDTPVFSSQLCHFKGTHSEKKRLGIEFTSKERMVDDVLTILNKSKTYKRSRNVVRKYYDRNINVLKIIKQYHNLSKAYDYLWLGEI